MKLRYLRAIQLILGFLILGSPVLKTITRTGMQTSTWFFLFELCCFVGLIFCRRAYRCPHCRKRLKLQDQDKCSHCAEPLDV